MAAVRGLSAARDLPPEVIIDALKAALVSAYHKMPEASETHVSVDLDEETGQPRVFAHRTVVDEEYLEDPQGEFTPKQASTFKKDADVGDTITYEVTPDDFGRIAAQTAKQVILQRIREAEREQTYVTYAEREGEIVQGTIQSTSRDTITVAILPKAGQIPGEHYSPNQRLRVYVGEVKRSPGGPQVIVTRTHRDMLKRLMELEIPEVFQGIVEIKAIAREAGSRSKVAVWSHQEGVDPVGACVGMRGVRIQALVRELGGEKIDVVQWDPDPRVFIANALSPAKVLHVALDEEAERRTANVIVPDSFLSLAIGREGQNARLAAKLTGWRIDIRSESEAGDLLEKIRQDEAARAAERVRRRTGAAAEEPEAVEVAVEVAAEVTAEAATEEAVTAEVAAPEVVVEEAEAFEPPELPAEIAAPAEEVEVEVAPPEVVDEARTAADETKKEEDWKLAPATFEEEVESDEDEDDEHHHKRPSRRLVRDPKTGKLVAEKRRKRSRRRPDWLDQVGEWTEEEVAMDDFDLFGEPEDFGFEDEEDEEEE
jgi:N utilization substance protein A